MADFKFACSHCQQRLQADENLGGRQIQCPACKHLINIPLSPAQIAAGQSPVTGHTWDTFVPQPHKAEPVKPPKPPST